MHYRRIACWLLGAWFIGSLAIFRITSTDFSAADEVLDASVPEIHRVAIGRGRPVGRGLMRYMTAELNRGYYSSWEWIELALGGGIIACLVLDRQKRVLIVPAAAGMVLVAFQHFWLSPEIVYLELAQSFPPPGPPPSMFQFNRMRMLYGAVEAAKLLLVLGVTVVLVKMQGQRRRMKVRRVAEEEALDAPPTAAL